jgi:hypothetical protein
MPQEFLVLGLAADWLVGYGQFAAVGSLPEATGVLVLQPEFVIFIVAWLAAGSGRSWRGAGGVAARRTSAAGGGHPGLAR